MDSRRLIQRTYRNHVRFCAIAAPAIAATLFAHPKALAAQDVSNPAILQDFETSYTSEENRMADAFAAGYGSIYTPPPGRADSGNQSVGYDQYDRFDLGSAGNPTLYGTETGLRTVINAAHTAGMKYGIDMVWNQSGFSDENTNSGSFLAAGGYPGFALKLTGQNGYTDQYGDYHNYSDGSDEATRLAGLIDIDQSKSYTFIRQPTVAGPNNIPAGTVSWNGRLANVPNANNARFYPDTSLQPISVYNPATGQMNIKIYPFNNANPTAGDPVPENALAYLMRNTQWMVQSLGVDFFRIDAAKNMPNNLNTNWNVLNYYDQAVYRESPRTNLDGTQENVWGFSEYYDGNSANIATAGIVKYSINPSDPGTIGGNRDALDFPLFFAMRSNLSSNGTSNNWNNVVNASLDVNDDGKHNGSQGVMFVSSPDDDGPDLSNVAYAYTLTQPGNALVYYNPEQFGTNRANSFPNAGRGDAMGGLYGTGLTTLVDLRDRYGRGNYRQRFLSKESLAIERSQSMVVLLSNRGDNVVDHETIATDFQPGQMLVELTGNASSAKDDPNDQIPQLITVNADKTINVSFMPNEAPGTSTFTGDGYLIYGLQTPQGSVSLSSVSQTIKGWNLNTTGMTADQKAAANATNRVSDVQVVTGNSFGVTLKTSKVNLLGNPAFRDHDADGDNALIKVDGGIDINGNGTVDFRDSSAAKAYEYGFENFTTVHQDGYDSADNNGTYTQNVNTSNLSEGYHYIEEIAFRHRSDGGSAVYSDWHQTIYVDRLPPVMAQYSNVSYDGNTADRDFTFQSTDETATDVHTFLNLPANLTNAQILAMVNSNNSSSQTDRDLFKRGFAGIPSGNNVITAVTYEIDGNYNIQRFSGINLTTSVGKGLGDIDHNNSYTAADVTNATGCFETLLYPNAQGQTNTVFNPSADINGDGKIDDQDLFLLPGVYKAAGATAAQTAAHTAILHRANINGDGSTNGNDITALEQQIGAGYSWTNDLNSDGVVNTADVDTMVHTVFNTQYGDVNLDGKINSSDFDALAANFGKSGQAWPTGDFNGDGIVNTLDFNALASNFGFIATSSAEPVLASMGSIVPEPVGMGFVAFAGILAMRRRNRLIRKF